MRVHLAPVISFLTGCSRQSGLSSSPARGDTKPGGLSYVLSLVWWQWHYLTSIDYTYAGTLSGTLPQGLCDLTRLEILEFQYTGGLSGTVKWRAEHIHIGTCQTQPSPQLDN